MVLSVRGGSKFQNALVREVVQFYHEKELSRYTAIQLEIKLSKGLVEEYGMYGCCCPETTYRPREFEIEVEKTLSYEELIKTMLHELIHVKQYVKGELVEERAGSACGATTWKKKDHTKTPYSKQPWERQAFKNEEKLYQDFMSHSV